MTPSPRDKNRNEGINKTSCGCSCAYSYRVTRTVRTCGYFSSMRETKIFPILRSNPWNRQTRPRRTSTFPLFYKYRGFIRSRSDENKYRSYETGKLTVSVVGLFSLVEEPGPLRTMLTFLIYIQGVFAHEGCVRLAFIDWKYLRTRVTHCSEP